mmetsp:Transcript_96035/g.250395  ORF Transcript_96035/g.250395 Transcript_96035/m.250395 type:complete len:326 (-) Transcript_96035:204-1181(-)
MTWNATGTKGATGASFCSNAKSKSFKKPPASLANPPLRNRATAAAAQQRAAPRAVRAEGGDCPEPTFNTCLKVSWMLLSKAATSSLGLATTNASNASKAKSSTFCPTPSDEVHLQATCKSWVPKDQSNGLLLVSAGGAPFPNNTAGTNAKTEVEVPPAAAVRILFRRAIASSKGNDARRATTKRRASLGEPPCASTPRQSLLGSRGRPILAANFEATQAMASASPGLTSRASAKLPKVDAEASNSSKAIPARTANTFSASSPASSGEGTKAGAGFSSGSGAGEGGVVARPARLTAVAVRTLGKASANQDEQTLRSRARCSNPGTS